MPETSEMSEMYASEDDAAGAGTTSAAVLDRTRAEDWARYTPRTSDVRRRATTLRRRRNVATPMGVVGLATVLAGGVVSLTGGSGTSGESATGLSPGSAGMATSTATGTAPAPGTVTATGTFREPTLDDGSYQKVLDKAVVIGAGTLGSHTWSVKVAVFASAADLGKVWPTTGMNMLPENLPASGPVFVRVNTDGGKAGGIGVMDLPAQPPAIPEAKPAVVDPWYAANMGVVTAVVDSRVDHLTVTSGGTTSDYHTLDVQGFRLIAFPVTGPGDITKIVAYDRSGTVLSQRAGHFLPYGVFPYELPSTDPRAASGPWG